MTVAREFVQLVFLKEFYSQSFTKDIYFKGGTAIRLVYGGDRFSEDLDFTVQMDLEEFEEQIEKLFTSLENKYPFSFKERKTLAGKTYLLTADIPLQKSKIYVKLDFSIRESVIEPVQNIIDTKYPVVMRGFINCLSQNEVLAEKIRATMNRHKHRDIYDLWVLLEHGAQVNVKLINEKLNYYGEVLVVKDFLDRLETFSQEDFVKDLRPFVPVNEKEGLGELFEYVMAYLRKSFTA